MAKPAAKQIVTMPTPNTGDLCMFLELPDELILEILNPLLIREEVISVFFRDRDDRFKTASRTNAQILMTCKRLHNIGIPLLYGNNKLRVLTPPESFHHTYATIFICTISPVALFNLTSLTMKFASQSCMYTTKDRCERARLHATIVEGNTTPTIAAFATLTALSQLRTLGLEFPD
jgi:hypothetical protein